MEPKENINFIFQLNNKARSTNFFILFIASGILLSGLAFYFVATNKTPELIASVIFSILYFIAYTHVKPSFFEVLLTDDERMQVNFYSVSSTFRNYQSIEIPLVQLRDFKLKKSMWGLKKELILSVQSKYGIADYPPVSISILNDREIGQVVHVLKEILNANMKR